MNCRIVWRDLASRCYGEAHPFFTSQSRKGRRNLRVPSIVTRSRWGLGSILFAKPQKQYDANYPRYRRRRPALGCQRKPFHPTRMKEAYQRTGGSNHVSHHLLPKISIMSANQRLFVRAMQTENASAVLSMAHALAAAVGDPEPKLTAADLIRDGLGPERWFDCVVAEVEGVVVGYALACKGYEAHTGKRRLWLGDLYVRPDARRKGVGRALIKAIASHAVGLKCDAVYCELWRANTPGGAFYQTCGVTEASDVAVARLDRRRLVAIAAGR
jgi:GNAT superfamily N-acetyltransferase